MIQHLSLLGIFLILPVAQGQEKQTLPDAPGKAVTQKLCSGCHGAELMLGKPHSEDGWGAVVADMIQRGAKGSDDEFYEVVQYLTQNIKALPKVNVNKATAKELAAVFFISEAQAETLVQARAKESFKGIDDLKKVAGIDAKKIDAQKRRIEF